MSVMPAQDDAREQQMLNLFNLVVPPDRTRGGLDAILDLDDGSAPIPFELKSTTSTSVATVRDFGPDHIVKWRRLHWLFAFYERDATTLRHCFYASPADMAEWITDRERYVRPDYVLAERVPRLLTRDDLVDVVGDHETYSVADARSVMKNQWSATEYRDNADLPGQRYSAERMLDLVRERCAYVIRRGATLNNPHIPGSYFNRMEPITKNHAAILRQKVAEYLQTRVDRTDAGEVPAEDRTDPIIQASAAATDDATA
jgi:hypothetical protein